MLADPDLTRFQVLVFVLNQPYRDLLRTVQEVRTRLGPDPEGVRVSFAGNLMTNLRMVHVAVTGQAVSLATLLAVMSIVVVIATRSPGSGLVMMAPLTLAILATYVLLVALGIPYGVAVSMFPTLVLGSAIDFAIHVRSALARTRGAPSTAIARELGVRVRGIILNGSLWMAGFAVLTFSRLPPNRYLGLLCATVFALSTLMTILWIPGALILARRLERSRVRAIAA
jgi:predicted RND superfamily exporter protein